MERIFLPGLALFFGSIAYAANFQTLDEAAKRAEEKRTTQEAEKKGTEKSDAPRRYWLFKPEFGRKYWLKPVKEYLSLALEMYDRPDAGGRQLVITQTESFVFVGEVENEGNKKVSDTHFYHVRFESGQDAYVAHSAIERTIGTLEPQIFDRDPGVVEAEREQRIAELARQRLEEEKAEANRKKAEAERWEASRREAARREAAREAARKAETKRLAAQRAKPGVRVGMTQEQVINGSNWGRPLRINKTTSVYDVREQWVYGDGNYLYFENGILTSVQTSR